MGIVGTQVFEQTNIQANAAAQSSFSVNEVRTATESSDNGAEVSLLENIKEAATITKEKESSTSSWPEDVDVVTYFIRPTPLEQSQQVATKIRFWKNKRTQHRIYYLPQYTSMTQKILSNYGVTPSQSNNVSVHRLQLDIFPLETDVLSLEIPDALREADVEGTPSNLLTTTARALLKLQDVVGRIPRIQALGPVGEEVVRKMLNMTIDEYMDAQEANNDSGAATIAAPESEDIGAMLVIDRKVDLVTPLMTPLTYEGLLDDVLGVDCSFLTVDATIINPDDDQDETPPPDSSNSGAGKKEREIADIPVHGSDTLYAEVRDQHVEKFGSFLQNQAKALKESHAEFTDRGKKKDLTEIHQFVKNIPVFTQNLRSLTNHIHLAELVKQNTQEPAFRERWQTERSMLEGESCYDTLEDLIACQYPPYRILQLLCLQSICGGGLKSAKYDALRRDIVQTYGYEFLVVLHNLEKVGMLRRRETIWDSSSPFSTLRKSLILINAEVNTVDPDDISYVSSGYAPLTVRLIQSALNGWSGQEEALRELPGRLVDIVQQYPPIDLASAMNKHKSPTRPTLGELAKNNTEGKRKPTLLVFFVGGVTYMEIAAIRFLSKRSSFPYHIICCTTNVINGSTLLQSLS